MLPPGQLPLTGNQRPWLNPEGYSLLKIGDCIQVWGCFCTQSGKELALLASFLCSQNPGSLLHKWLPGDVGDHQEHHELNLRRDVECSRDPSLPDSLFRTLTPLQASGSPDQDVSCPSVWPQQTWGGPCRVSKAARPRQYPRLGSQAQRA